MRTLVGKEDLRFEADGTQVRFTVPVSPGPSSIRVRSKATPIVPALLEMV